jgi:hypothetical protein
MTDILCPAVKDGVHRCKLPPNHEGHEHYCSDKCEPWEEEVYRPVPMFKVRMQIQTPEGRLYDHQSACLNYEDLGWLVEYGADQIAARVSRDVDEHRD